VCTCVYVYIHLHIYSKVIVYVYIYMYTHVYTIADAERRFICEGKLILVCVCICVYIYPHLHIYSEVIVYVYIYMCMHVYTIAVHVYTIADAERRFIREGKLSRVRKRHESAAYYTFYVFDDALVYASEDMAQVCVCVGEV